MFKGWRRLTNANILAIALHRVIKYEKKRVAMKFPNPKALLSMALLCAATASQAVPVFTVDAKLNSSTGGVGLLTTVFLTAGQSFSVFSGINDLASAGPLPRFSDADGLDEHRLANALDDSGQPVGTVIGENFGLRSQGGLLAPFGALVGQINNGNFFFLGRSFNGPAPATGLLKLFYFDSNAADNSGSYNVSITNNVASTDVPEPESYALMLAGLTVMGFVARRRR